MKNYISVKLIVAASLSTLCLSANATPLGDALKPIEAKINALTLTKEDCVARTLSDYRYQLNNMFHLKGTDTEKKYRKFLTKKIRQQEIVCKKAGLLSMQ